MEEITVIDYNSNYFDDVIQFWQDNGLGGAYRGDTAEIIEKTILAGGRLFLMLSAKKVIGTSWITHDSRRSYIHHFGISSEFRRKGLGFKLMETTMDYAYTLNYQVKLEVHRDNQDAISLYRKFGFSYLGDYMVLIKRDLNS